MSEERTDGDWMEGRFEYVGFWARTGAALIGSLIVILLTAPLLHQIYGTAYWEEGVFIYGTWDIVLSWLFPFVAILWFWRRKQATPGEMVIKAVIVDVASGATPTTKQWLIRYLGYYVATIPLGLGILWVAHDPRKQGWHDKMAGTVVVRALPAVEVAASVE